MKKIFCVVLLIVCLFVLCSCARNKEGYSYNIFENVSLTLVAREKHFSIYVHNETGVMYIAMEACDAKHNGGISVMLEKDGKPLIYEGEYE